VSCQARPITGDGNGVVDSWSQTSVVHRLPGGGAGRSWPPAKQFLQCASVASGCAAGVQALVTTEYRVWVRQTHRQLGAETGASESEVLADALITL
jgi:hypothetical protein